MKGAAELSREREIVSWVARLGAVSVDQIGRRFGVGRSVGYDLVRRLVTLGLLERTQTVIGDPSLISATRDGITYAGLGLKRPALRIGQVDHWLTCADVAIELEARYGADRLVSERELRFQAQLTGKPLGAAKVGEMANGSPRVHWPDLAVHTAEGLVVYEVELTPKSRRRLDKIIRAWRRAREVERCVYLCPRSSPTQQVVAGAIRRVAAEDRVYVDELRRTER
jgi:transposase